MKENSTGIKFSEIRVPEFDKVINTVKYAHKRLAHFKLIGWDMSVDIHGNPILIEFNTCPGVNQVSCGPTFGDLTDKVLDEFFNKRTLAMAQN